MENPPNLDSEPGLSISDALNHLHDLLHQTAEVNKVLSVCHDALNSI